VPGGGLFNAVLNSLINLFDYGGAQALAFDALKILSNLKIRDSRE